MSPSPTTADRVADITQGPFSGFGYPLAPLQAWAAEAPDDMTSWLTERILDQYDARALFSTLDIPAANALPILAAVPPDHPLAAQAAIVRFQLEPTSAHEQALREALDSLVFPFRDVARHLLRQSPASADHPLAAAIEDLTADDPDQRLDGMFALEDDIRDLYAQHDRHPGEPQIGELAILQYQLQTPPTQSQAVRTLVRIAERRMALPDELPEGLIDEPSHPESLRRLAGVRDWPDPETAQALQHDFEALTSSERAFALARIRFQIHDGNRSGVLLAHACQLTHLRADIEQSLRQHQGLMSQASPFRAFAERVLDAWSSAALD